MIVEDSKHLLNNLTGQDQKLLSKLHFLRGRVVQNRDQLNEAEQARVVKIITLVMGCLVYLKELGREEKIEIEKLIEELALHLQKQENVERVLVRIMNTIRLGVEVSFDPLKHPVVSDICIVLDEFDEHDARLNLSFFPASGSNPEDYLEKLNRFNGRFQVFSEKKIANFIDDPQLSIGTMVVDCKTDTSIPDQCILDIRRSNELWINQKCIFNLLQDAHSSLSEIEILELCGEELNEPIEVFVDLSKFFTQASLARPCIMMTYGFSYSDPDLDIRLTQGLYLTLEVINKNPLTLEHLPQITILHKVIFGLKRGEESDCFKYFVTMRKFTIDRTFLGVSSSERKGKAELMDLYSMPFDQLEDAKACNFEVLQSEITEELLDQEPMLNSSLRAPLCTLY